MVMHVDSSSNQTSKQDSQSSVAGTTAFDQLTFVESQQMTSSNTSIHLSPPSSSSPEQLSVAKSYSTDPATTLVENHTSEGGESSYGRNNSNGDQQGRGQGFDCVLDEAIALVQEHAVQTSFNGQLSSNSPSYTPGPRGSIGRSWIRSTSGGRPAVPDSQDEQVTTSSSRDMPPRHSYSGRQRPLMHVGGTGAGITSGRRPTRDGSFRPPQPRTSPPPLFPLVNMGRGNYGSYTPDRPLARFDPSYAVNDQFFHMNTFQRPYNNLDLDLHRQYQGAPPRNFMRPIIAHKQTRPFITSVPHAGMMMPNQACMDPRFYQEPYENMHRPLMTYQQPPFFNPNLHLYAPLVKQINYYFSDENLPRDKYLREHMDAEGWVPLKIVAKFPRVVELTTEIDIILEALATSTEVVVKETSAKDYKIRKSNHWWRYTYQKGQGSTISNSLAQTSANTPTTSQQLQKLTLKGAS